MNPLLSRISTGQAVVNYFKNEIQQNRLAPGDRLPSERLLQEQLGISRFSLREGLARLSALGIIEIIHGKGAFVSREINSESFRNVLVPFLSSRQADFSDDLFEARIFIEGALAVLAAQRRSEADLDRMRVNLERSEAAVDDAEGFGRLDYRFHRLIAAMAGNRFLTQMLDVLDHAVQAFLYEHARDPDSRQQAVASHRQIFKMIEARNSSRIGAVTRRHIAGCKNNYETAKFF